MEHNSHDGSATTSVAGTLITVLLGILAKITKEDVLVYISIIAGVITIGYTIDKWIAFRKNKKINNNEN